MSACEHSIHDVCVCVCACVLFLFYRFAGSSFGKLFISIGINLAAAVQICQPFAAKILSARARVHTIDGTDENNAIHLANKRNQ